MQLRKKFEQFKQQLQLKNHDIYMMILGNAIMAFALVNIHIPSKITEGGVIGLTLLLNKLFGFELATLSFLLDLGLYFIGYLLLANGFIKKAIFNSIIFFVFYRLFLSIGAFVPSLEYFPALAAILGGILIGVGCGLVVTRDAASSGDDCYALIVKEHTSLSLSQAYFTSDFTILLASYFVYLPLNNVVWSLLTTVISSYIIGQFEINIPKPALKDKPLVMSAKVN